MKSSSVRRTLALLLTAIILSAVALVPAAPAAADEWQLGEWQINVKFTGVIRVVPANPGDPWVIGGQTVAVGEGTSIVETKGPAEPGMFAEVMAERLADNTLVARMIIVRPPEVRLRGAVSEKPEGNIGPWTIAGVTVWVTEDTRFSDRGGAVNVGNWVEAVMLEGPAGVLTADRIVGIEPQPAVFVSGAIQLFDSEHWLLSSITVHVDANTLISGEPAVDIIGHAIAELREDGTLLGLVLRAAWFSKDSIRQPVEFTGVIEALPRMALLGMWTVSGQTVIVMPSTQINQEKGLAVVGAEVNVVGWQIPGAVMATQITVLSSPEPGGQFTAFVGVIEELPAEGLVGIWTISGQQVQVTEYTRLDGVAPRVGARAMVSGIRRADTGLVVASWIRVLGKPADVNMRAIQQVPSKH